ncbi:hypothetical protein OEZ85_000433 [Tetradesmus obliquus]|uniref:Proteasome adapter and scaffold protein ECM29 HEAT-repeat domain-containing protein n=1 Tax=Tetradesmus obliquus TaxID=3088 RepID=A0ABY8UQN8_TETOB|nr:hypothetical protein OEZ85_000433 [Tetradesmus obliquus]
MAGGSSSAWQQQVAELRERAAARQAWLCHWLAHHHQPVRLAAARLTALAAAAAQPAAAEALLQQLLAALPPVGSAGAAGSAGGGGGGSSRLEEQEGSLLAAGLILARSASCGSPALPAELQQSALAALTQQLRHHSGSAAGAGGSSNGNAAGSAAGGRSLVLAGAAALALGFVSLAGQAALPGLLTDGSNSGGDAAQAAAAAGSGSDSAAPAAAAAAATGGAGSGASSGSSGSVAPGSVLGVLLSLAGIGKDSRAALRAVAAVGYIAAGSGDQQVHLAAAKGLLALSCSKGLSEELLLGLGEAAAAAAGDVSGFNPALLLWSNLDSIADCVDAAEAAAAGGSAAAGTAAPGQPADQQQAAAMDVDTATAADGPSSSSSSSSSGSSRGGVQEYLLAELGKMAVAPKEEVRCASCLLLVSLLQLCKGSGLLAGRLPQLQATFTGLLGDSNELTQDLAARGVSLVYSRGGAPLQQQLLGQLLGLLQGGPGAPAAAAAGAAGVKLAGDSKLFEEGQLGATPGGGGLTTYRELCSLANDLGQPDLVYRFMDLARASSALSAKRGAAVGVARIARLAAAATPGGTGQPGGGSGLASLLGPARLASLLPKLYRLCHDPSPKVSDSMSAIWAALLDDPRAAVDAHYDDIMKSLLADVGARLWRVRQAACASLSDLLAGRRWPQLAPHLEQLWVMGLRAADDVKESVRGAAGGLVRSLRGLSLRLMDAAQSPAADVAGCCGVVLPLLAGSQGLGSSVPELRGVAADVLCSGIKSAGSAQVLPVLPGVVPVLLEALSGMEDARLNYVEQHAESIGLDADQLAAARLAAARSSSITEALDAASRALTGPAAVEMAPALADLVRRGVGLSSKVGAASFMRGLAARLGQQLKPAAPTLLKPLVAGVAREPSAPVKRAYAAAAAAVAARCCGDKRRDKFVADAVASYGAVEVQLQPWRPGGDAAAAAAAAPMAVDEPSGGGEDAARQAGGLLLRELLRESSDTFNAYAAQVLPVAFVASHDEVASVASAWVAVWSQGCPSEPAALRLHAAELAGLLAGGLGSSAWPRKRAAAKALSALAEVAPDQLGPYSPALAQLLLAEASGGRLWEGKEGLMACLGGLGAACAATLAQQPGVDVLLGGLLSAAARKKTSYRAAALAAMQKVLVALLPLTRATTTPAVVDGGAVWGSVSPPLLDALQQHLTAASAPAPAAKAEAAAGAAEPADEVKPLPLPETCSCLGAAWKLTPDAARAAAAPLLVKLLAGLMAAAGLSWTNWLAVVMLAQAVVEAAAPARSSAAAAGGSVPAAACVPLAGGLVHVIQHSTISQLRGKCLEVLVQLLQTFEGDAEASRAFLSADGDASSISSAGGESAATGAGSSSLSSTVACCMATVASQDPSAAHTALAGRATAVLQRLNST